jgi:thiamine biosynthesis lipoprotein
MRLFTILSCFSWLICSALTTLSAVPYKANEQTLTRFAYTEYHMGVDVRIVVYAPNQAAAERACEAAFNRFAELDTIMSDYRADSELMRLCARAGGPPVPVSRDLFTALQRSQEVAERSDGAFDVTCGPLVALWRKARKTHALPAPEEIAQARSLVGWKKLQLDPRRRTARLLVPGMKLDLGGIGKGYADDCAQKVLKQHGITRALVEAGGDIVVSGPPPGQDGWKIQVSNARAASEAPVLLFANAAISTSGDTEQFVEIGGRRYSHILDPHTGQALTDRIQVTIVARDGLTSDSLSTAVSVLGPEKGQTLVSTYRGTKAYIRFGTDSEGHAAK